MRLTISFLCLLFFGCKTSQFSKAYTLNLSDIERTKNCYTDISKSKITGNPLNGLYKIKYGKKVYSYSNFKNGELQNKKSFKSHKLLSKHKLIIPNSSVYIEYYSKKTPSLSSPSKLYDSIIHLYSKKYPIKTNIFYSGTNCEYRYSYNNLTGRLKIIAIGCRLETIPFAIENKIINTTCNNNPLTFNTKTGKLNKNLIVEIVNKQDTIYNYYELNKGEYVQNYN